MIRGKFVTYFQLRSIIVIAALTAICASAYAQQPPDVVNSNGNSDTAMGTSALLNVTTGCCNTASGFDALQNDTTGSYNTASGVNALATNTIGYQNTASGVSALANNTSGAYNTASGYQALYLNLDGNYNTASGVYAAVNWRMSSDSVSGRGRRTGSACPGSRERQSGWVAGGAAR
jgi:hypothetical protein